MCAIHKAKVKVVFALHLGGMNAARTVGGMNAARTVGGMNAARTVGGMNAARTVMHQGKKVNRAPTEGQ